jgi:hypothetical protein
LLEIEATLNNMLEITNSPDIKPNMPIVQNRPVATSLYRLIEVFIFTSQAEFSQLY